MIMNPREDKQYQFTTITGDQFPTQVHLTNKEKLNPAIREKPVDVISSKCNKALWTSDMIVIPSGDTYKMRSPWMMTEHADYPWSTAHVHLLVPADDAKILILDSEQDCAQFKMRYMVGKMPEGDSMFSRWAIMDASIDWERVRTEYDAIHMTMKAVQEGDLYLRGWDCPSTMWLNWTFKPTIVTLNKDECEDMHNMRAETVLGYTRIARRQLVVN